MSIEDATKRTRFRAGVTNGQDIIEVFGVEDSIPKLRQAIATAEASGMIAWADGLREVLSNRRYYAREVS